jgi:probable rRNA maturation factor
MTRNAYQISTISMIRQRPMTEKRITALARMVLAGEKIKQAEISIAIVGDRRMADMAERYAKRRYRTDVFAFNLEEAGEESQGLVGQIIVNGSLAKEQFHVTAAAELGFYIVHGLLHLCGYDDHTPAESEAMHKRAGRYLARAKFKKIPPLPCNFGKSIKMEKKS